MDEPAARGQTSTLLEAVHVITGEPNLDVIDSLEVLYQRANEVVGTLEPEQLGYRTPCTDWDVRRLIEHVLGSVEHFTHLLRTGTPDGVPPGEGLGDDPAAAFATALADNLAAWRVPGTLERILPLPFGDVSGESAALLNVQEVGAHLWDLAKSIGQDPELPADVASLAHDYARQLIKPEFRAPTGPFGQQLEASTPASTTDKFVAFLGRPPQWHPPT
jgi:uncharacterized protein (TIGR03086 family)